MAVKEVRCYRCQVCGKPWMDSLDASECCLGLDDTAWACGNTKCDNHGVHDTEEEAEDCAAVTTDCVCGHERRHHSVGSGSWPGCYDIDCRCSQFKRAQSGAPA